MQEKPDTDELNGGQPPGLLTNTAGASKGRPQGSPLHPTPLPPLPRYEEISPAVSLTGDTVEGSITASEIVSTDPPPEPDISTHPTVPLTPPKRYFQVNWWSIVAFALLLVLVGEHLAPFVWPLVDSYLHPKATITLFPTQRAMSHQYAFLAVTGTADQSRNQVPSRVLSFTTPTKSATITTTGTGYTPAIQAKGTVILYNEANYNQTIAAGTVIAGNDGRQIVTDQTVTIAAGNPPYLGSSTVLAHSLQAGEVGNIQALDINGLCCLAGIYAKNTSGFSGGLDPKPYPMLSHTDLERETQSLAGSLSPLAKAGTQKQALESEQFLQPMQCSLTSSSHPKVGERAITATVSVSETCSAQVFDVAVLQKLTSVQFVQDSQKQLGSNFIQRGNLSTSIEKTTRLDKSHHTCQLTVSATGTLILYLSQAQMQALKMQIAGKKITEAQRQLLALAGVQGVAIQPAHQTDISLPTDPNQITMQEMSK